MNKAVVVFLEKESFVSSLIESGIWVKGVLVQVSPLSAPVTRVVISRVPPFIKDKAIMKELARFSKFARAMKMIPLGCKSAAVKHVLSFRRQVFMFLTRCDQHLAISFRCKHGDGSYVVFASTERLRCFECGDIGHTQFGCAHRAAQQADQQAGSGGGSVAKAAAASGPDHRAVPACAAVSDGVTGPRADIVTGSLNINGARDVYKREVLAQHIRLKKLNVVLVQETHSDEEDEVQWRMWWKRPVSLSNGTKAGGCSADWKCSVRLLQDAAFCSGFQAFWARWSERKAGFSSLRQWWDVGKAQIKLFCQQYTAYTSSEGKRALATLERSIAQLQQQIAGQHCEGLQVELEELRCNLGSFFSDRAKGALVRARFQMLREMDAPSSFFFNLEKKCGETKHMHALYMSDDRLSSDTSEIRERAVEFYSDLYEAVACDDACVAALVADLLRLTMEMWTRWSSP
ncbi:hypothetical protein NFI96_030074 [Prochilodus magdalenae]|nr:hypothetical protein NFI96_030074 [Prochilodus magdalenae]